MTIKIEKGVPMPAPKSGRGNYRYPFGDMEIGDSFLCDNLPKRVRSAASLYGRRNKRKFAVHKVEGGVRVWRIK